MCLTTKWGKPRITKNDRVVYKIVWEPVNEKNIIYRSAIQNFPWKLGVLVKRRMRHTKGWVRASWDVTHGLHAYKSLSTAKYNHNSSRKAILKAIIPAGSEYYIGHDGEDDIVANQLMCVEVIK